MRRRIGTLWKTELVYEYSGSRIVLGIEADKHNYRFTFEAEGEAKQVAGEAECGLLATEVAGGFTGVFFGMYATGNGKPCKAAAYFDRFDYTPADEMEGKRGMP